MSYILDALRRADAERDRGAVPNIHSKPVAGLAEADEESEAKSSRPLVWAMGGLSVLLLAVVAWHFLGSGPAAGPVPAPVEPVAMPAPEPSPLPTMVVAVAPPQADPPVAERDNRSPAPARVAKPKAAGDAPDAPGAKVEKAGPGADDEPVVKPSQLPDNIRRELPQLSVGGAMYSKSAANRMLILNGQVFHEGDKVLPDLVLEQIRLKSAVLSYKGHRYGIDY